MNVNLERGTSLLELARTHPGHISHNERYVGDKSVSIGSEPKSFGELLQHGIESVNDAQHHHEQLATQALIDPDSVDVHDITIASATADLSIRIARNIIDRSINAYRELTTLR